MMSDNELVCIIGGASSLSSGSFWNSVVRVLTIFLELGRNIGSAINYKKIIEHVKREYVIYSLFIVIFL